MANKQTLIAIYEAKQIREVLHFLEQKSIAIAECHFVALEYEVEGELLKRAIPYTSVLAYVPTYTNFERSYYEVQKIARESLQHPALRFYAARGIALAEAHQAILQFYLDKLIHAFYVAEKVVSANSPSRIIVPHSMMVLPSSAGLLALQYVHAPTTAFKHLAEIRGLECMALGSERIVHRKPSMLERVRRGTLGVALNIQNFLVESLVPPKPLKLFVSDYWRHIKPFITKMDDVELVVMDRTEAANIGLAQIWRHRMRFYHPRDFETSAISEEVDLLMREYATGWEAARQTQEFKNLFVFGGMSFWKVVEPVFEIIFKDYARKVATDAVCFEELYKKNTINRVLLRAGRGGQYHYFVAAHMAHSLGIPSIELQHAGAIIDPEQAFSLLDTSYVAAYGSLVRDLYVQNHGYAPERIVPIGSPRFDWYLTTPPPNEKERAARLRALGLDPTRPVVLVSVPWESSGLSSEYISSYEMIQFFRSLQKVQQKVAGLQIIFKFRANNSAEVYRAHIARSFPNDVAISSFDDLFSLIQISDMVTTNYSTVMYESMIGKKPLILFPWKSYNYALRVYQEPGLYVATDEQFIDTVGDLCKKGEYYAHTVEKGEKFLSQHYSFDGKSAERLAALLRSDLKPLP
ncbi:MAG: CDP-glycerol glycerophosphotransferase family protein [Patescibacteria group bacterium]